MIFTTPPADFTPGTDIVACYLLHGKHLLLLQRQNHKPDGGKWGLPAGKVDAGEALQLAVSREIHEETGLMLSKASFIHYDTIFVRHQERDFNYHRYFVTFHEKPEVILTPEEHATYAWVTPEEALALELVEDEAESLRSFFNV